ncbi:phenylacetate--CoA ligase family protein [Nitrospirota bacterium]
MIFDKKHETLPREELEALQSERLVPLIKRVYEKVPHYKQKMDDAGIKPGDITSVKDLHKLPFTTKIDLRDTYPFGMFAEPMDNVVRVHVSSGTTGKPTVVGYTANDIDTWAGLMARSIACAGGDSKSIVHNAYGYGLFTGGLGAHYGGEKLGATVVPASGGNTKRQIMLMQDFEPSVLLCTPSYALNIAEVMQDMGVDPRDLNLKVGIFGAEPWSDNMRDEIEKKLDLTALNIYGLSEVMGPGVSMECIEGKNGLHVFEDHFIAEIIDPDTGKPLPPGETGELVFTTITKEAFPMIRYRTKDITSLMPEPCACGRTFYRMNRVSGRTDDMLIIRGVNLFPSQVEHVLMGIKEVEPHYSIIVDRKGSLDTIEIQVEVSDELFSDEVKVLESLSKRIEKEIKDLLGISSTVKLVEPRTIQRSEGKAQRVTDKRKL